MGMHKMVYGSLVERPCIAAYVNFTALPVLLASARLTHSTLEWSVVPPALTDNESIVAIKRKSATDWRHWKLYCGGQCSRIRHSS